MTSATSETSQHTIQCIPGVFEGDATIIQDSTKSRQRGLGQTEPTESESSLRERLSSKAARYRYK
jgi:hypothetical protein